MVKMCKGDYQVFYNFHKLDDIYEDTFREWAEKGYIHMDTNVHVNNNKELDENDNERL